MGKQKIDTIALYRSRQ